MSLFTRHHHFLYCVSPFAQRPRYLRVGVFSHRKSRGGGLEALFHPKAFAEILADLGRSRRAAFHFAFSDASDTAMPPARFQAVGGKSLEAVQTRSFNPHFMTIA